MDSLSSSGLTSPSDINYPRGQLVSPFGTASNTKNQQQRESLDKQQQQPTPRYTTVGSVYNPQASQPLQPPARRGRTIKWPPTPHSESPHPLYKSALSDLSYRTTPQIPQTPPSNLRNFQHYSPLRQNFDRAVSPPPTSPAALHFSNHDRDIAMQMPPDLDVPLQSPKTLANMLRLDPPHHGSTVNSSKHDTNIYANDGGHQGEDGDDADDDDDGIEEVEPLRRMSVKSLTNLASYLNPMQKPAQKLLTKAQLAPTLSDPYAQEMQMLSYQQQEAMGEQRNFPLGGFRHTRSDPVATGDVFQSDRVGENSGLNRPMRIPPGFDIPQQRGIINPAFQVSREPTPGTFLSKGPGVPQPLTAGPPGQRQYRNSALESMNAMSSNFRRPQDFDEQALMPNPYNAQIQRRHPQYSLDRNSSPSFESEGLSSVRAMLAQGKAKGKAKGTIKSKVVDSLSAEDVHDWYLEGLPANFGCDTMLLSQDWIRDYPLDQTHERRRIENCTVHMSRTLRHFYSGTDMFNKSIAEAIEERNRRAFHRTLGVIGGERKKTRSNAKMIIEDAIAIPTHEHAEPLLSMAFQTFANYNDTFLNGSS